MLAICSSRTAVGSGMAPVGSRKVSPLCDVTVYGCDKLQSLLDSSRDIVQRRLNQSPTIAAFCLEFRHILEQLILRSQLASTSSLPSKIPPASYYTRLLEDIASIGWEHVAALNNDLNRLSLRCFDSKHRMHELDLIIPSDYPLSSPTCKHQLPSRFEPRWSGRNSSFSDLFAQFRAQLELYQDIWSVLDDLDEHCYIIEPLMPLRSDLTRRVSISRFASLRIEFSVQNPHGVPSYSFIGAESTIAPMRERLTSNIHEWDYRKTPRQNLEILTSIEFPRPVTTSNSMAVDQNVALDQQQQQQIQQEPCAICYAYKLGESSSTPDQICDNTSCGKTFHATCLYDWFQSANPALAHRSTATNALVWGACPYCEHKISVRNPNLTK